MTPDVDRLENIDELRAVHRASVRLQHILLTEELAVETIRVLEDTLGYEFAAILLVEKNSDRLIPFALSDQGQGPEFVQKDRGYVQGHDVRLGHGITGWVAENGTTVRSADVRTDERYLEMRTGIVSELCVPMWSQGHVIGVVNVETSKPDAYQASDQRVLEIIATQIAVAIENSNLNQSLAHSQRMDAIGRLASGIAHDFNNLLTVINGYAEMSLLSPELDDRLRSNLKQIALAGNQAANMTRQLLAFGRNSELHPELIDPGEEIKRLTPMLQRLVGEDVIFSTDVSSTVGLIEIDPTQFCQVLINLAVNAKESMTDGGKLEITTSSYRVDKSTASSHDQLPPGRYVLIKVSDTGSGMDESVQRSLFEPFFTTKNDGSGLGLAVVHGVVQQSGGRILVKSRVGIGTCFELYFAAIDKPTIDAEQELLNWPIPSLAGQVLVVEDEDSVRNIVVAIIESLGYSVISANSSSAALEIAGKPGLKIGLVISDVVMPSTDGPTMVELLRKLHPDVKVLFMSGYPPDKVQRQGTTVEPNLLLAKPFTRSVFKRKMREILKGES